MRPTISVIVKLPQMHYLLDCSGIGLEISDQFLVMVTFWSDLKVTLLIALHRFGHVPTRCV
jgi:hypothetical protein